MSLPHVCHLGAHISLVHKVQTRSQDNPTGSLLGLRQLQSEREIINASLSQGQRPKEATN